MSTCEFASLVASSHGWPWRTTWRGALEESYSQPFCASRETSREPALET